MNWLEALILGIIQGLTEFLPVSSSGHLEIGKYLMDINAEKSLLFTVVVHGATVMSTIVVFWKDLIVIFKGFFQFKWNEETKFVVKIFLSMIPVLVVGIFFKDSVESFFDGNMVFVGSMLLVTAGLLSFTSFSKSNKRNVNYVDAIVIGIAQALAVLPGISRSGATISAGILLGNKKESVTRFSFLMVLIPIIGANFVDILGSDMTNNESVGIIPLIVGFLAAFIAGWAACTWMISIVKRGKLIYFAIYCFILGGLAISAGLFF
ncbi:MAG: undecaprenyl-diphosphate phosphatase [Bacteroidetes bacterium]|nr:undecaprenyl-diphosphate phosphatase [Bacteroidota bacterium]